MSQYLIRRLVAFIPTLLAVAVLVALLMDFIPGDPVQYMMGEEAPYSAVTRRRQQLGLDRPVHVRLVAWLSKAAQGDLGESFMLSQPVSEVIAERYPVTISLTLFAMLVSVSVGIPIGIIASVKQGSLIDWGAMTTSLIVLSIPGFWLSLNLILLFGVALRWLPVGGYVPLTENPVQFLKHIFLPGTGLGLGSAALIARFTRTSMLEVLRQDYVTTSRAKGLSERVVVLRHALRNALVPIVTVLGIQFGGLLSGAFITEVLFVMPGVGRMVVDAVMRRDYPLVQGGVLVIAISYLAVNLLTDALYGWIDPRIRY